MRKNIITTLKEIAIKYPDNAAVQSLILQLEQAQLAATATMTGMNMLNPLAGFELAVGETDGYTLMQGADIDFLKPLFTKAVALQKVTVITDCLWMVLDALEKS